ncbi:MAG: polysaccharide ABC transporter ATP-binding protein [Crocinitomicaceae bacterium]|nr:polysaccharide ABC transporter ATP-binding protein [Crocinitomicaceae bacterium]
MEKGITLSVSNLSKQYTKTGKGKDNFWALKDVSFDLKKGEILGVIGRNGAGKSTLLKILSEITAPTSGEVVYSGTLTSIIDIGTGFHPDLSGKENVFLNASLLGYSKKDTSEIYDTIVEFSGLEEYMDMPVKHYSSGMYLRLAFSVAFHSKIDILLLDEVLAVGDVDFRRKCYHKIRSLKDQGVSIIFVSHFLEPIISFCDRCILIEGGNIDAIGEPIDIVEKYMNKVNSFPNSKVNERLDAKEDTNLATYTFDLVGLDLPLLSVESFEIGHVDDEKKAEFSMSDAIRITLAVNKKRGGSSLEIAYSLKNMNDIRLFVDSYGLRADYQHLHQDEGVYHIECTIPGKLLNRGVYTLGMIISENGSLVHEIEDIARIKVITPENERYERRVSSVISPHLEWKMSPIK